jgi:hypothetical protein
VTIRELTGITRKENFIYYRREFTATAHFDLPGRNCSGLVEFTIETEPTGKKDISVKLLDQIDYPLLPVVQKLKETIISMDREGQLP